MKKKKEKFRLAEKDARLDVRITTDLRDRLEYFCLNNPKRVTLTDAVTNALEDYLRSQQGK